jgi:hypothetical protein
MDVLVVEDNSDLREVLTELFRRKGFSVVGAADGRRALERIEQETPGVIVLDLWLPEINGWEFLDHLRQMSAPACDTPVVVLTAVDRPEARPATVDVFLHKPVDCDILLDAVREKLQVSPPA